MIALAAVVLALPSLITVSALTITNPSLLLPNSTIVDANYAYQCSGDSQGRNLDSASCMEALGQIDASSTPQKTWGQRGTGAFDVKLPKRYTSSNGLCIIEPRLISGSLARASLQEVAGAARTVIDKCVNMMPSQGGKARRIGSNRNLDILVSKPYGQPQCSGSVSPSLTPSCQNLLDIFPASHEQDVWGPADDVLAGIKLPKTYYSQDQKCQLTIRSDGRSDWFSRYQMWSSAWDIFYLCIRQGKMGARNDLGMSDHLSMEMGPV